MTMKRIRIADLKARLSRHLRFVRRGGTVVVLDRETPIARIVPWVATETSPRSRLRITRPPPGAPAFHEVPLPPPLPRRVATELMRLFYEDRNGEREP
jgi:antitoxin (DNA-binding transcriptional repressor) of toxin-antitoxin stability system